MNDFVKKPELSGWPIFVLLFMTGACVLVIEIIGTRILSPVFGSGIYTWTSLIATTLAALSLGYAIGGRIADKHPSPAGLFLICFAAGLWTVATPRIAAWLLPILADLPDMRIAILLSSMILFFPNLSLLGAIGPFAIRLITASASVAGTNSGLVFSISTAGSLLAAILSGFLLIPNYSVLTIFNFCGFVLIAISAAGFLYSGYRRSGMLSILAVTVSVYVFTGHQPESSDDFKVLHSEPGFYGNIQVVQAGGFKTLLVDGIGQNYVTKSNYMTAYINFISALPLLQTATHGIDNAVVIGVGAGELPMLLSKSGIMVDAVDIDMRVFSVAKQFFDFDFPEDQIFVADGRQFLSRNKKTYDLIVLDAFNSDLVAWHLLSKEALASARTSLSDKGMLVINLTSLAGSEDVASLQATLNLVFPYVSLFSSGDEGGLNSFVFTASSYPISLSTDNALLTPQQIRTASNFIGRELDDLGGAVVFSDDFNPVSYQRRHVQLQWRKEMRDYLGKEQSLLFYN